MTQTTKRQRDLDTVWTTEHLLKDTDDLKAYLGMLRETSAYVRERMKAGLSLDEAQSAGLPEKWDEWGSGFIDPDRWIATIHRSYGGDP